MPQCQECYKPIDSGKLCRPCREEHMDPDDVTQEFPLTFDEQECDEWAPEEDGEQNDATDLSAWREMLGLLLDIRR